LKSIAAGPMTGISKRGNQHLRSLLVHGARAAVRTTPTQDRSQQPVGQPASGVSFFTNKFRKLGFIHYKGGIEVHSSLLNVVLYDEPHIETEQIET
jgi:hypothetical protein